MGNLLSAHSLRGAMLQASFEHTYDAIRDSDDEADRLAGRVHDVLTHIARGAVQATVSGGDVSAEDVRRVVELIHEWMDILDTDCLQCRLPELARTVYESELTEWDLPRFTQFAETYVLNVCGFISDDGDAWHVSDEALAHMVERINKAELITNQSVTALALSDADRGPQDASPVAASAGVGALITNPALASAAQSAASAPAVTAAPAPAVTAAPAPAVTPALVSDLSDALFAPPAATAR